MHMYMYVRIQIHIGRNNGQKFLITLLLRFLDSWKILNTLLNA